MCSNADATSAKTCFGGLGNNLVFTGTATNDDKINAAQVYFNILFLNDGILFHIVIHYNLDSKNPIFDGLFLRKYFSGSDITKILLVTHRPVTLHGMAPSMEQLIYFFDSEISIIMRLIPWLKIHQNARTGQIPDFRYRSVLWIPVIKY